MTNPPQAVRISFRREDFRIAIARPLWPVVIGASLVAEALCLCATRAEFHQQMLVVPAAICLGSLFLWLLTSAYRVEVGPEGILWRHLWHRPQHTRWDTIRHTRRVNVLGMEYLLIHSGLADSTLWLPLFVTRYEHLRDLLVTYTDQSLQLNERLDEVY